MCEIIGNSFVSFAFARLTTVAWVVARATAQQAAALLLLFVCMRVCGPVSFILLCLVVCADVCVRARSAKTACVRARLFWGYPMILVDDTS